MLRWLRCNGKLMLPLLLTAVALSACATRPTGSSYKVKVPTLAARPLVVPCRDNSGDHMCAVVLINDYTAIIRELKAACLANRQTPAECQVNPVQ